MYHLMIHNGTYLGAKTSQNEPPFFCCKKCDYTTCKIGNWKRHLKTKKHNDTQMVHNDTHLGAKRSSTQTAQKWVCGCGKSYKYHSGYYRHKKTCKWDEDDDNVIVKKENDENMIIASEEKFMEMVMKTTTEIIKNIAPHMGTNTNSFNTSNNFNINLFLNEECSNALSIQDFAKRLTLTMQDLSTLKENEPKAIQGIIKNNLQSLTITERPMHNHEKTWYVKDKDDGWEDDGGEKIIKTIKTGVSQKSGPTFVDNNPDFLTNEKKGKDYAETMAVAMKEPTIRCQNKILKAIEKDCSIDN